MKKESKKVVRKVRQQKQDEVQVKKKEVYDDDNTMTIIVAMIVVVVLSILVLRFNERIVYNEIRKANMRREEATVKNVVPDEDIEYTTEEEYYEDPSEYIDLNKYELIKGIVRLFPTKNDSKVKGDNVYKKFNLKEFERHEVKLNSYYGNYRIYYHYIDGSGDTSAITVYNRKTKKVLYTNNYVKTALVDENDKYHNLLPTISGGKLHLLAYNTDRCYIDEYGDLSPYLEYVQIPLSGNNLKEKEILSLKGFDFGEIPYCR